MTAAMLPLRLRPAPPPRRRAASKQLSLPTTPRAPAWRPLGKDWEVRPAEDGDVRIRRGPRERLFEAYRVPIAGQERHCVSCGSAIAPQATAYREADPPRAEPVPWRDMRFCAPCIEGVSPERA